MKETKYDAQRLFDALSTHEMLEEIARRETFRQQEDKKRVSGLLLFVSGIALGMVLVNLLSIAVRGHI